MSGTLNWALVCYWQRELWYSLCQDENNIQQNIIIIIIVIIIIVIISSVQPFLQGGHTRLLTMMIIRFSQLIIKSYEK